jgi:hypothetical protein
MRKRFDNGITQVEISSRENRSDIRGAGQKRRSRGFSLQKPPCRAANILSDHWQSSGALGFVNKDQRVDGRLQGNQVGPAKQGDRRGGHSSNRTDSTYKKLSQHLKSSAYKKLIGGSDLCRLRHPSRVNKSQKFLWTDNSSQFR